MEPEIIRMHLRKRRVTIKSLASYLRCRDITVYAVIRRKDQSRRIQDAICRVLGMDRSSVFPAINKR